MSPHAGRRGGISQHSLLFQLTDDEAAVVVELVALVTELKLEGGIDDVRYTVPDGYRG